MTASRKSKELKKSRKQYIATQRQMMRDLFGYSKLKDRGLTAKGPEFPDLKLGLDRGVPCSDTVGNGFMSRPLPPDAKEFPVGQSHKQGPMLITSADRLEDMGGRKT